MGDTICESVLETSLLTAKDSPRKLSFLHRRTLAGNVVRSGATNRTLDVSFQMAVNDKPTVAWTTSELLNEPT